MGPFLNMPAPLLSTSPADGHDNWPTGDALGLPLPADAARLRQAGSEWLTRAFHAMGSLPQGNSVSAITRCDAFLGGGSGTKALLSVTYARPDEGLPQDLFVKFSRNFADPEMDRSKFHMGPEIRFAALSRMPGFPVTVPPCLFADFSSQCGTGLLITARIGFGKDSAGGYGLTAHLIGYLPGLEQAVADGLMAKAHEFCPYSKATRGNIDVELSAKV